MKIKVRIPIATLGAILISLCSQSARADMITIGGNLRSDGSAVGSGDPVISDRRYSFFHVHR